MHSTGSLAARVVRILAIIVGVSVPTVAAFADPVTLMWDANPEPDIAGYIVYVGTSSGTYTKSFDVGNVTGYVFPDAVPGQRYYFAVAAYAGESAISEPSAELAGFSNAPPSLAAPADQASLVGKSAVLQLRGTDPYGEPVSYRATGLPPGLSLTASTGLIAGTPITAGTYAVTATATDGVLSASQPFTWTVTKPAVPVPPPTGRVTPPASTVPPASTIPKTSDRTPPRLIVTSPTSAVLTVTGASNVFTLSGTATDAIGVKDVLWRNSMGGTGTAAGTSTWTATVRLKPGSNFIAVMARDAAGNSASLTRTVVYNPPVK